MDAIVLRALVGVATLLVSSCSLVVDTSECSTNSDCDFGDDPPMQCVSNECVPVTESTRQALVPAEIREDLVLDGSAVWVFGGIAVIEPHAKLTVGDVDVEVRPESALVVMPGATLECTMPCPEIRTIVLDQSTEESQ